MSKTPRIQLFLLLVVCLWPGESSFASGMAGQRIVVETAIHSLPDPPRSYLARRIDAVLERAIEPDGLWRRRSNAKSRQQWHYLMIDAAAQGDSQEDRMKAARAFPTGRPAARKLFRQHGIKRGGLLPWELQRLQEELAAAFAAGDEAAIIELAGHVAHFCADAADPFCCSKNACWQESGDLAADGLAMGDPLFAHQNAAHRTGWELVRRNAERYRQATVAVPIEYRPVADPVPEILAVMAESLGQLDALCEADSQVYGLMRLDAGDSILERADEFYQLLDERCGQLCVDSLHRGARLAAGLIGGAWEQAGSPLLDQAGAEAKPSRRSGTSAVSRTPKQAPNPSQGFAASKNSKVYHRLDCTHVQRINAENLVNFKTRREATDSGRHACKSCRSDKD